MLKNSDGSSIIVLVLYFRLHAPDLKTYRTHYQALLNPFHTYRRLRVIADHSGLGMPLQSVDVS